MKFKYALFAAVSLCSAYSASAASFSITPDVADAQLSSNNATPTPTFSQDTGNYQSRIGELNAPGGAAYVFAFQLPTLDQPAISAANIRFQLFGMNNDLGGLANADIYGLGVRGSATVLNTDYYQGPLDPAANAVLLQQNFLTPASPLRTDANAGPFITLSSGGSDALTAYLNTVDPGGVNAGQFVFFRVSYDLSTIPTGNNFYALLTQDAGGTNEKPQLSFVTIPEPGTYAMFAMGGFGMFFLRRRKAQLAS